MYLLILLKAISCGVILVLSLIGVHLLTETGGEGEDSVLTEGLVATLIQLVNLQLNN